MSIKCKEFSVPLEPDFQNAALHGMHRHPNTIRVFYDDTWKKKLRNGLVFFSGGNGLNIQTELSPRVKYAIELGYVFIDTMVYLENFPFRRNINFPSIEMLGAAFEIPAYLKVIYQTVCFDPDIQPYFCSRSKVALLGHSRGAGALLSYANLISQGSKQLQTPFDHLIQTMILHSPMGSGHGGYPAPDRTLRAAAHQLENLNIPITYVVAAGDLTHTSRPMMVYLYNMYIKNNPYILFKVIGDDRYTHNFVTDTKNQLFKSFLDLGKQSFKKKKVSPSK
jgi:hypothetical protein